MKTILRIGLILISVMAIWVACFAQNGTRPANQSPAITALPSSGTAAREDLPTKLVALRDSFVNEIKNNGFNPGLPAPRIVMDNPLVFGSYEPETNVLHISTWEALSPEQKAIFSQLASATGGKMSAETAFEMGIHQWVVTHELGHWWQACVHKPGESHFATEVGANRIAASYWRIHDPKLLDWVAQGAHSREGAFPNHVPDGQSIVQYFDANYEKLQAPAYLWYQNRMILDVLAETPPPSFRATLEQPIFSGLVQPAATTPSQAAATSPRPAAEIQALSKALVGRWSTTYKFEPGGMVPEGGDGDGEEVWRTGPGGFTLMEEEHVRTPFGEVFLLALQWWDKSTKSFRGMLCNNSGPAPCDLNSYYNSSLKWDGEQLTIDMQFPQNSKKMVWHEVWSGITATSFTQTGDMGEVGGPLKRAVTIHGTKVAEVVQSPFAGTWKTENPVPTPGTITYSKSSTGGEHFSNNRNSEYDFAIDGEEYPTDRPASTVAWVSTGPSSWDCVEKIRDRVTRKIHLALYAEGQTLTMTYTWFNPANRTANGSSVYARVSGGPGLEGSWKMLKRIEEPDTMTIAFPVPGQMYVYIDPIDNTWAGPTDGTFMAVQSPMSPPGMTTAFRTAGPRKMTSETRLGSKTLYFATLEVSDDGNTMTRTTWAPAKEDQKTVLTLKKQN